MHEKERRIQEQRTRDAASENLLGFGGKIGCILKNLGQPIIAHSGSWYEANYLPDPYEEANNDLPIFDEEETIKEVGWVFDGLNRGMPLEITYIEDRLELYVTYEGFKVFSEISGELDIYKPAPEWLNAIDRLYEIAKIKNTRSRKNEAQKAEEFNKKERKSLLNRIREKWGI